MLCANGWDEKPARLAASTTVGVTSAATMSSRSVAAAAGMSSDVEVSMKRPRLLDRSIESTSAPPPSADLWEGQTDEGELGFSYADADIVLYHLVDRRMRADDLVACGFDATLIARIRERVRRSHFKRVMPLIAKVSLRTVGHDFLYPRDWEAD